MKKKFPQPEAGTYPTYYDKYFSLINKDENILEQLNADGDYFQDFILALDEKKFDFRYANEKWTVAQVIQHIIDTERILSFRALCIVRGEKASLPGFDENEYIKNTEIAHKDFHLLSIEFYMVRQATISLLLGMNEKDLTTIGKANNADVSVIALTHMIVAHARHHFNVIKEKYDC